MALKVLSKDGFYGWVNMAVMFFFNIAIMLIMVSFGVFLPSWVEEFAWNRGMLTGANTLMMILTGIAAPMVGIFIMKQGARRAILIGNIINVCGLALLAYQDRIWHLYLGFGALIGIGLSLGGMLAMMTVINNWFIKKRSIALAVSMASMGISGTVMTPALMGMIHAVGWRNTYLIIAAIVLTLSVIIPAIFLKNKPEDLGQVPDGPVPTKQEKADAEALAYKNVYKTPVDFTAREAIRTRTMWLLVGYGTMTFLAMNGLMPIQIDFLLDIGLSDYKASAVVGVFSAIMAISQLGIGFLGLRFKMHSLAVVSIIFAIIGFAVLMFSNSMLMALTYCTFLGIGFGIQSIAMGNLFPDYFGRTEFPKIMGYTMPFTIIIAGFGGPIAGFIRESAGTYIPAFQLFLGFLILAFLCIIFARPPVHPSLKKGAL
ncbi:MAG: MFS transporter [Acidobacteria bacterium]|nr:MFS transporter [Acidobacteriota bacterium]